MKLIEGKEVHEKDIKETDEVEEANVVVNVVCELLWSHLH